MAKYTFTQAQFDEICSLLKRRTTEPRDEQKSTRAKIRRLGFMISDYFNGFSDQDFRQLMVKGDIEITENPNMSYRPAPVRKITERVDLKSEEQERTEHKKRIESGENGTVEFKPILFGKISGKDKTREMRLEVAEVICSFLNTKGGYIYIGVTDDGKIDGIPMEGKKNKDEYLRHFSQQVKKKYFTSYSYVIHHYISEQFVEIEGKDVFVIQVRECKKEPVYLYNQEKPYGSPFQFFIREGASTEPKYCPKQLVDYIEEKWWNKKYK